MERWYYYDEDELAQMADKVIMEPKEYVAKMLAEVAALVGERPEFHRMFGIYWWAMKDLLAARGDEPQAWFQGAYRDPAAYGKVRESSTFHLVLAAMAYCNREYVRKDDHDYYTDQDPDEVHTYTLTDPDVVRVHTRRPS